MSEWVCVAESEHCIVKPPDWQIKEGAFSVIIEVATSITIFWKALEITGVPQKFFLSRALHWVSDN